MSKKLIGIDLDDTLWDLLNPWVNYLNAAHAINVKISDIKSWEMQKSFPTLTTDEIFAPLYKENFWKDNISISKENLSALQKLYNNDNYDIYFVTASHPTNVNVKYNLLKVALKTIGYDLSINRFISICDKKLLKLDYLVDDNIANLIDGNYTKLLITKPYNSELKLSSDIIRCNTFVEAINKILNS